MKEKTFNLRFICGFALILILAVALIMSGSLAKYTTGIVIANDVDYTNQLAESFMLLDQPIEVQEDGSYKTDTSSGAVPTSGFSYKLIPGITIPAAPYVEIKNKTVIPAYLYLEVDNSGAVELTVDSRWTQLDVTGKKGGTVYSLGSEALVGSVRETQPDGTAEDDVRTYPAFTVNTLSKIPAETEGTVKVYAYLIQKVEDQTAKEAFQAAPTP